MEWEDVPEQLDVWTQKIAAQAYDLRTGLGVLHLQQPTGYYIHPDTEKVAIFSPSLPADELKLASNLIKKANGSNSYAGCLSLADLSAKDCRWVKVAYSPTVRRTGELLNFFPGQYVDGVPNYPSPFTAMLTSGLLGAGLGWAAGKGLKFIAPNKYGDNLARTGAIIGGLAGAAPGAVWAGMNVAHRRPVNDNSLLNHEPGTYSPQTTADQIVMGQRLDRSTELDPVIRSIERYADDPTRRHIKSNPFLIRAVEGYLKKANFTFGEMIPHRRSDFDVNINALGQTLWQNSASPQLAAQTMGTMYAAQQLPDPSSEPNLVTGHQLGQLAARAAGDYSKGWLVGAALNAVVGTPYKNSQIGKGVAALGVIGAIIPKLFGR